MTKLQGLQIRKSEISEQINAILGLDARTDEQQGELEKLTAEGQKIEPEIRAAIVAEPDPNETRVEGDAETRELALLTERSNVGDIFSAAVEHRNTSGETAELQKHYGINSNQIPLEMLRIDLGVETRAAATVPASIGDASQAAVITPGVCHWRWCVPFNRTPDRASWRRCLPGPVHHARREGSVLRFDRSGPDRRDICCNRAKS